MVAGGGGDSQGHLSPFKASLLSPEVSGRDPCTGPEEIPGAEMPKCKCLSHCLLQTLLPRLLQPQGRSFH